MQSNSPREYYFHWNHPWPQLLVCAVGLMVVGLHGTFAFKSFYFSVCGTRPCGNGHGDWFFSLFNCVIAGGALVVLVVSLRSYLSILRLIRSGEPALTVDGRGVKGTIGHMFNIYSYKDTVFVPWETVGDISLQYTTGSKGGTFGHRLAILCVDDSGEFLLRFVAAGLSEPPDAILAKTRFQYQNWKDWKAKHRST